MSTGSQLRPGFFVRKIMNPIVMFFGTTLAVRGRRSGEWRRVPVNVLDHDGARYLVAPRGDTDWTKNLRAVRGGELRRRGSTETFTASEVADVDKAPIIAAYRDRWDSQTKQFWESLPDPADHPVFRIDPTDDAREDRP